MVDYINKALEAPNQLTVREFIDFTNYPIDTFMIDRFWAAMENDTLIYIDDSITKWMGYDSAEPRKRKEAFVRLIARQQYTYLSNEEYEKFLSTVPTIANNNIYPSIEHGRGKSNVKHLLLPSETLKMVMMQLSTSRGNEVRKYYVALEKLFNIYTKYQSMKQMEDKDNLLKNKELEIERISTFNQELINKQKFTSKDEILYVGSTLIYAKQGLFKVSKTKDLKARNATHNTTHHIGDKFIILHTINCSDALHLEQRVKHILKYWRPSNAREFYKIPFRLLVDVLELLARDLDTEEIHINTLIDEYKQLKLTSEINYLDGISSSAFNMLPAPTDISFDENIPADPTPDISPTSNITNDVDISFNIRGWTKEQTYEFLDKVLLEYKATHNKYSWQTLSRYIISRIDPAIKKSGIKSAKVEILRMCKKYDINI